MSNIKLKWYGDKAKAAAETAGKQALGYCAADLQGKSAAQAPIDTGDLRANCSVGPIEQKGHTLQTRVGYDLPYAIIQHEHMEYKHPKGGGPKYLENPYNANRARYEKYIKDAIKKDLKRR